MTKGQLIRKIYDRCPDLTPNEIDGLLYLLVKEGVFQKSLLMSITGLPEVLLINFLKIFSTLGNLDQFAFEKHNWTLLKFENNSLKEKLANSRTSFNQDAERAYDQFYASEESSVGKFMLLKEKGLIKGNNVLLLGDDDLVSLLFDPESGVGSVFVLDVDTRLIDFLNKNNIQAVRYDARHDLPTKFQNNFDLVLIDPPYTEFGVRLFLQRGIEALKARRGSKIGHIVLNFGAGRRSYDRELKIQQIISDFGLVVEDKINNFTHYTGAETIGNSSSIYVLRATGATHVPFNYAYEKIYTYEISPYERFPFVDHVVIKVKGVSDKIIKSKTKLSFLLGAFCKKHRFKVVDTKITGFKGGGYTFVFVLASSNLCVHTWPEHNALHFDLVTCAPIFAKSQITTTLSELFETKTLEIKVVE